MRILRLASSTAVVAACLSTSPALGRTISTAFNPANFSSPTTIDNTYFPLVPGTTFVSKATNADGCEVDVTTVTNDTRQIDGVETVVVHDQVFQAETCTTDPSALAENTFDYYAQDSAGNVWYMGEDTFTCQGAGNCTPQEGGWIAGVNGAQPGIIMLAEPRSGDSYKQEYLPGVAQDEGMVTSVGVTAKMTRDDAYQASYSNCIVTKEWSVLERGSVEYKTYCPNVGVVQTVEHHGKVVTTELTSVSSSADALRFRTPPKH